MEQADFISCEQLDINQVLGGIAQYAEDMDYKEYSFTETKKKTNEINARSEW